MSDKFVGWFRSVAPYIHLHRGKTLVIACPGNVFVDHLFNDLAYDLGLLSSLGVKLVLVHGARPQIDALLAKESIQTESHLGVRVTAPDTLPLVEQAIGKLKIDIEARLSIGLMQTPTHHVALSVVSGNYLVAQPIGVKDGVDFHYSGKVRKVNIEAIQQALDLNQLVLISSIGYSPSGEAFNLHYEEVASKVAMSLKANKLIYMSTDKLPEPLSQHGEYTATELMAYIDKIPADQPGTLHSIMRHALDACQHGVDRVHIVEMNQTGSLLLELFTHKGIGLMITKDPAEIIRQASMTDIAGILNLIEPLEQQGILVRRDRQQLEREIDRFYVLEHDHRILGCMAIFPLENQMAELACFVVHPDHRGDGYAGNMLKFAVKAARRMDICQLFVLTTQTAHWFLEHGFYQADVDALPMSKRELYNWQRASKILIYNMDITG